MIVKLKYLCHVSHVSRGPLFFVHAHLQIIFVQIKLMFVRCTQWLLHLLQDVRHTNDFTTLMYNSH